jgi:ubiquinone/menaquinone biosynthesis C-methylase UbiE
MEPERAWQLDVAGARSYEEFLVAALLDPWAGDLVETVGVEEGERVVDVACGTGIVARHAARRAGSIGSVDGVDLNPAMLTVAREVAADVVPEIRWHEAPAERLPFDAASFDVALCQQALQFFADRSAALAELHRVTAPGGRLGVATCRSIHHQPGYEALAGVITRHLGIDAGEIISSPYALGEPDELRSLVQKAGFDDVHVRIEITPLRVATPRALLEGETTSSPLGDVVAALDDDVAEAILDDLSRALQPYTDDDGIVFPFQALVATATR